MELFRAVTLPSIAHNLQHRLQSPLLCFRIGDHRLGLFPDSQHLPMFYRSCWMWYHTHLIWQEVAQSQRCYQVFKNCCLTWQDSAFLTLQWFIHSIQLSLLHRSLLSWSGWLSNQSKVLKNKKNCGKSNVSQLKIFRKKCPPFFFKTDRTKLFQV